MKMKQHILAALREEFAAWEGLLAGLSAEQISAPLEPPEWTIKDVIAHLMAWQQRTNARVEAAHLDREPQFPPWAPVPDPHATDEINAWIYETYRGQPWPAVYRDWQAGFQRLLETSEQIAERDMLDGDRYPWMDGLPLALYLLATYDHHQEHYEKMQAWLQEHGIKNFAK
jgi:hypothetical protein